MLRSWLALAIFMVAVLLLPRSARADQSAAHSVSVAVLAFDSDDAEEQADALTGALRSRIRASQGWSLVETSQSLGMLTAALRCTGKPIAADCQQRISDQIKAERYIFGYVIKGPTAGQVTADVHLFQKGKPDTVKSITYADNLKDQNDEALRAVAQKVLDALGGNAVGTIVVRTGANDNGEVVVDGDKRVPLHNGVARVELSPGTHSVEVAIAGQPAQKRNVVVTAGKETPVALTSASAAKPEPARADKPFPTRKVVGGGLAAVGVAAGVVAVINFLAYQDDESKADDLNRSTNPAIAKLPPQKSADDVCGKPGGLDPKAEICKANDEAYRHSTTALIAAPIAGVFLLAGAYFLFTDGGSSDKEKAASKKPTFVPSVGTSSAGFILSGSF